MSFFVGNDAPKRRRQMGPGVKKKMMRRERQPISNEEVSSESEDEEAPTNGHHSDDEDLEDNEKVETALEKRYRLTKEYLKQVEEEENEKAETQEADHSAIAHRLKEDAMEQAGRLQRKLANECIPTDPSQFRILKGHHLPPTCLRVSNDSRHLVSASKDGAVIKWDLETGQRLCVIKGLVSKREGGKGHTGEVLSLAVSHDDKLVCTGGMDSMVNVWDFHSMDVIKTFTGHRGRVSGLSFRSGHNQLFSCSHDRSLKIWNLDEMGYVDTMYGHQDAIVDIDSLQRERAITCGGRDRTIRVWKVPEESQLVYRAHKCGSVDVVRLINEDHFVSGADDGSLSVWSAMRKKPIVVIPKAHSEWLTSIATQRYTDLVASGSWDGAVKLWRCDDGYKGLTLLHSLKMDGFINAMAFTPGASALICAVGQEHKNGRWWRLKDAKNALVVCPLTRTDA